MIDLRNDLLLLYDFYIVAKENSFSKAAQTNNVSQPNLSRNIKELESKLNLLLVKRNNKGISLTKDGIDLYNKLDKMFGTFNMNNSFSNSELNGVFTIGTTRNIADNKLYGYLNKFVTLYPNVKVKIWIDSASNLNKMLSNHEIDLLIDYLPYENKFETDDLQKVTIDKFKTCFACSKNFYEINKNNIKTIKDLQNYKLIIPGKSRRKQALSELLTSINEELTVSIEMPDSKLMAELVNNNDYIGYFILDEALEYNLIPLMLDVEMPYNYIGLIYYKSTLNLISRKFIDLLS